MRRVLILILIQLQLLLFFVFFFFSLSDINFWLPSLKEELFQLFPHSSVTHLFLKEMAFVVVVYSISRV